MPRIIAGRAGGIPLVAPKGQDTRPTADKTKEALFSIVQNRIPDSQWLDLYAGTGQIGLEAVSRGAARAVLVEQARASLAAIDANLAKCGMAGQVTVRRCRILPSSPPIWSASFIRTVWSFSNTNPATHRPILSPN